MARETNRDAARQSRMRHASPSRRGSFLLFFVLTAALVGLDQWTKALVRGHLPVGGHQVVFPGAFGLTLLYNDGAAFGMLSGRSWLFVVIAVVFLVGAVVILARRTRGGYLEVVSLALVAAGAIGNMTDRLVFGRVTDFIETLFVDFPIFNVADICVTFGVVLLACLLLFTHRFDGRGEDGR